MAEGEEYVVVSKESVFVDDATIVAVPLAAAKTVEPSEEVQTELERDTDAETFLSSSRVPSAELEALVWCCSWCCCFCCC